MSHHRHGRPARSGLVTVRRKKEGDAERLVIEIRAESGWVALTSASVPEIIVATAAVTDLLNGLHADIPLWPTRSERGDRARTALESACAELTRLVFPGRNLQRFLDILDSEVLVVASVRWVQGEDEEVGIPIPWNMLWLPDAGEWLGVRTMFRPDREYVSTGTKSLWDVFNLQMGYAEDNNMLGARADWSVPAKRSQESWAAEQLAGPRGKVNRLADFTPGPLTTGEQADFSRWLAMPLELFHVASIAPSVTASSEPVMIGLRRDATATNGDIRSHVTPVGAAMLNVRNRAAATVCAEQALSAELRARGTPAICAPSYAVEDRFAMLFVRLLYRNLSKKNHVLFDAVQATQRRLVGKFGHPMALFYIVEGDTHKVVGRGSDRPRLRLVSVGR